MKKVLVPIFVFTLLIALPAISWYYLKSGLSWRRTAMNELNDFGSVRDVIIPIQSTRDLDMQDFEGKLSIFYRVDCSRQHDESEVLSQIVEQFEKRKDVRFFVLSECRQEIDLQDVNQKQVLHFDCDLEPEGCNTISNQIFKDADVQNIVFVDGNLNIRNYYKSEVEEENKRLIEHMAMMLPDERKKYGRENE